MQSSYFEAILQIRPADGKVLDFLYARIYERKGVFISKEVRSKTGIDIYLSDQKFARMLGPKLKKAFGGTVKSTRSLFSVDRQRSKKIYRVTVCYRMKGA